MNTKILSIILGGLVVVGGGYFLLTKNNNSISVAPANSPAPYQNTTNNVTPTPPQNTVAPATTSSAVSFHCTDLLPQKFTEKVSTSPVSVVLSCVNASFNFGITWTTTTATSAEAVYDGYVSQMKSGPNGSAVQDFAGLGSKAATISKIGDYFVLSTNKKYFISTMFGPDQKTSVAMLKVIDANLNKY